MAVKKNGRFFIKFFAVIILVSLLIGIVNHFYIRGFYYKDTYGEVEKMQNVPYNIVMTNVGTSHGLASFKYPDDGVVRFNLALSGEDIYHNFQTLKQFTDHFSEGCIVAIPVSYFSFCMPTDEPSQKRHYTYLDKKYIKDFSYETLINAKYIPVLRSGEYIIKDLINDQEMDVGAAMMQETKSEPTEPIKANNLSLDSTQQSNAEENIIEETKKGLESHASGRVETWRSGYFISKTIYIDENVEILTEMVEYCYSNGFKPILVSTPIYTALNEKFTDEELKNFYFDNMYKVQKETGVPFLDLSHDNELSNNPLYYGNSDHMNRAGAEAFYKKYIAYLSGIGYM